MGNMELGVVLGATCQLIYLSYIPVGGANIPDNHIAANLTTIILGTLPVSLDLVGKFLPVIILLSIFFMYLTKLERKISTGIMIRVPYEDIIIRKLIQKSFLIHLLIFLPSIYGVFFFMDFVKNDIISIEFYSGFNFFLFAIFFASGSLLMRFFKRGFGK
jgi:mannose/fructose/N-acetylgalactosamine-specific phosphotransferase system component IIC